MEARHEVLALGHSIDTLNVVVSKIIKEETGHVASLEYTKPEGYDDHHCLKQDKVEQSPRMYHKLGIYAFFSYYPSHGMTSGSIAYHFEGLNMTGRDMVEIATFQIQDDLVTVSSGLRDPSGWSFNLVESEE